MTVKRWERDPTHPVSGQAAGRGFSLMPGERLHVRVPAGAGELLRFHLVTQSLRPLGSDEHDATLRIWSGHDVVARFDSPAGPRTTWSFRETRLPPGPTSLRLEVEGEDLVLGMLSPTLGGPGPATELRQGKRPDIVVFLADTFRADSLSAYGGRDDLTPNLNRIAGTSTLFAEARSTSTWTLPAHGSLLAGLYPEQHTAVLPESRLPDTITTLAEALADAGYRTGAITDANFVSRKHGLHRGFEFFLEEREWSLASTLESASAWLAAEDGRPTFMFVQTYRTHMPYRVGPEEDSARLGELLVRLQKGCERWGGDGSIPEAEAGRLFRELYDAGVQDLDEQVGRWIDALEARAFFDSGVLVFTSDHGEVFLSHGKLGHGGVPWEGLTRVPLFLHGQGWGPTVRSDKASLVDLPSTLVSLAGLPVPAEWAGRDLAALEPEGASYAFIRTEANVRFGVVAGSSKLFGICPVDDPGSARLRFATDLRSDAGELHLTENPTRGHRETWQGLRDELLHLLEPRTAGLSADLAPEDLQRMAELGYGGD